MATDPGYDGEARFDVPPFVSGLIFGRPFGDGEVPDDTGDPALEWSPSRMLDLVESSPAGPTSMTILEGLAPRVLNSFDRVRLMELWDRQTAHCQAQRLAAMTAVVDDAADRAFVSHEIAAALHVTRPVADHLVNACRRLARTLPVTARALADGRVTETQAIVLSDETGPLTAELAGQVEARLIPNAEFQTAGQFRSSVRKLVAALDPDGFAARHAQQRTQTDVTVPDYGDGVSGLVATLTTPDAAIIKTAVDAWADHHRTMLPETTVAERRCAALVDWARRYLAGPAGRPGTVTGSTSTSSSTSPPCSASPSIPPRSPATGSSPHPSPASSPPTAPGAGWSPTRRPDTSSTAAPAATDPAKRSPTTCSPANESRRSPAPPSPPPAATSTTPSPTHTAAPTGTTSDPSTAAPTESKPQATGPPVEHPTAPPTGPARPDTPTPTDPTTTDSGPSRSRAAIQRPGRTSWRRRSSLPGNETRHIARSGLRRCRDRIGFGRRRSRRRTHRTVPRHSR
jgi:hypothetical protein